MKISQEPFWETLVWWNLKLKEFFSSDDIGGISFRKLSLWDFNLVLSEKSLFLWTRSNYENVPARDLSKSKCQVCCLRLRSAFDFISILALVTCNMQKRRLVICGCGISLRFHSQFNVLIQRVFLIHAKWHKGTQGRKHWEMRNYADIAANANDYLRI